MRHVLTQLRSLQDGRSPESLRVLDHGCGSGKNALKLLSLGYDAYGVDVMDKPKGRLSSRFFLTDGTSLPFADESFDFIYSQNVLEHVAPAQVEAYYSEASRVLKPGGVCYQIAPHRLRPYDSHSNTWLLHWLPHSWWGKALKLLGKDGDYYTSFIFLRSRRFHLKMLRRFFDDVSDLTFDRVLDHDPSRAFKGPKRLRLILDKALHIKPLSRLSRPLVEALFSFSTVATKRR